MHRRGSGNLQCQRLSERVSAHSRNMDVSGPLELLLIEVNSKRLCSEVFLQIHSETPIFPRAGVIIDSCPWAFGGREWEHHRARPMGICPSLSLPLLFNTVLAGAKWEAHQQPRLQSSDKKGSKKRLIV